MFTATESRVIVGYTADRKVPACRAAGQLGAGRKDRGEGITLTQETGQGTRPLLPKAKQGTGLHAGGMARSRSEGRRGPPYDAADSGCVIPMTRRGYVPPVCIERTRE